MNRSARLDREPVVSVADGYLRPRWRGKIHLGAFGASLLAVPALVSLADSTASLVGLTVYGLSLVALFGTSAAYHLLARSDKAQQVMRRLDHSMIFIQIAGTYTPVCLLALPARWGTPILVVIWSVAALGIAVKLSAGLRVLRASNALYAVMGFVALGALPVILSHLTAGEFVLLAAGGVFYTVGAILFAIRWPALRPTVFGFHEVWHAFTVVAALAHFALAWLVAT